MVVRNTFLIVLFVAFLSYGTIAQNSDNVGAETSSEQPPAPITTVVTQPPSPPPPPPPTTTTAAPGCPNAGDFPLFGPTSCISKSAYTGIFLTSIILAGISFLMLIGLLILYFIRRAGRSGSSYSTDDEGSVRSSVSDSPPPSRQNRQKGDMLKKESPASPTSSSAPYTAAEPVSKPARPRPPSSQYANASVKPSDSYEMPTRPTSKQATNTPRQASSPPVAVPGRGGRSQPKSAVDTNTDTSF